MQYESKFPSRKLFNSISTENSLISSNLISVLVYNTPHIKTVWWYIDDISIHISNCWSISTLTKPVHWLLPHTSFSPCYLDPLSAQNICLVFQWKNNSLISKMYHTQQVHNALVFQVLLACKTRITADLIE